MKSTTFLQRKKEGMRDSCTGKRGKETCFMLQASFFCLILSFGSLGLLLALNSQAEDNRIKATVDRSIISVGDLITLRLEVRHTRQQKIEFLSPGSHWGEWTVRTSENVNSNSKEDDSNTDILVSKLTIYKTGEFEIPPIEVRIVDLNGTTESLASKPIKIQVRSVLTGDSDTLKGLKKQAEIPADYKPFLSFLAALCAATLLIYRLFQWWKGRRQPVRPAAIAVVSPDQEARIAIRRLLARKLPESGLVKEFYLELSEIIKRYLGAELSIQSLERTTREFTEDMKQTGISWEILRSVKDFLTDCDQVKFAKYLPSDDEIVRIIDGSYAIIDATSRSTRSEHEEREVPA